MSFKSTILYIMLFVSVIFFAASCNGNIEDCRPDSQDLIDCNGKEENNWLIWGLLDRATRRN